NEKQTPTPMLVLAAAGEVSLTAPGRHPAPAVCFEQSAPCAADARITASRVDQPKDKHTGDKDDGGGHATSRARSSGMGTAGQELHNVNQAIAAINSPYRALYTSGR